MRAQLYTGIPLDSEKVPSIPGIWAEYAPRTNLIWLLFILKNLVKHMEQNIYTPNTDSPKSQSRQPLKSCPEKVNKKRPQHVPGSKDGSFLKHFEKKGDHKASESVTSITGYEDNHIGHKLMSLQATLNNRLIKTLEILDLEHGRDDMCCAADLVAYAIDQQWLNESDFFLA